MGWDSEFFLPKNTALANEAETGKKETKFVNCAECNKLISLVSRTLYEIDHKHYCSDCYSQKITYIAVERDHHDLNKEKKLLQK